MGITELQAGRELDALVASKVMGITWDDSRCRICGWPLSNNGELGCCRADSCSMRPAPAKRADGHAPYSTDIAAAMSVWQKLRESNKWCCLKLNSDYHYCWTISLWRGESSGGTHENAEIHIDGIEGGLESLAHAICIAALRAVAAHD